MIMRPGPIAPDPGRGDDVELMDEDSGLPEHRQMPWPRLRMIALHSRSAEVTGQRLRDYLSAMGHPVALADQGPGCMQDGEGDAVHAFARLRLLISDRWRQGAEAIPPGAADASTMARLCSWLEPGHTRCPPWLENLFDTPPIHRRSMAPEAWDE